MPLVSENTFGGCSNISGGTQGLLLEGLGVGGLCGYRGGTQVGHIQGMQAQPLLCSFRPIESTLRKHI